mgnify:CR=1 FL=1
MSLFVSQGAETVAPLGWVLGVMTALFGLFFIGWTVWAWLPSNRQAFEEAAKLPLEEG